MNALSYAYFELLHLLPTWFQRMCTRKREARLFETKFAVRLTLAARTLQSARQECCSPWLRARDWGKENTDFSLSSLDTRYVDILLLKLSSKEQACMTQLMHYTGQDTREARQARQPDIGCTIDEFWVGAGLV